MSSLTWPMHCRLLDKPCIWGFVFCVCGCICILYLRLYLYFVFVTHMLSHAPASEMPSSSSSVLQGRKTLHIVAFLCLGFLCFCLFAFFAFLYFFAFLCFHFCILCFFVFWKMPNIPLVCSSGSKKTYLKHSLQSNVYMIKFYEDRWQPEVDNL